MEEQKAQTELRVAKTKPDLSKFKIDGEALQSLERVASKKPDLLSTYKKQHKGLQSHVSVKRVLPVSTSSTEKKASESSPAPNIDSRVEPGQSARKKDKERPSKPQPIRQASSDLSKFKIDEAALQSLEKVASKNADLLSTYKKEHKVLHTHSKKVAKALSATRIEKQATQTNGSSRDAPLCKAEEEKSPPAVTTEKKDCVSSSAPNTESPLHGSEEIPEELKNGEPKIKKKLRKKAKKDKDPSKKHKKQKQPKKGVGSTPLVSIREHSHEAPVPGQERSDNSTSFRIKMDGSVTPSDSSTSCSPSGRAKSPRAEVEAIRTHTGTVDEELGTIDAFSDLKNHAAPTAKASCCHRRINKRNMMAFIVLALVLLAAVMVIPLLMLLDSTPDDGIERLDSYSDKKVVSTIPFDLCIEGFPGQIRNSTCSRSESPPNVGSVCDLVAQAMMNVTGSNVALLNAGACRDDIRKPEMTVGDIQDTVPLNDLVVIETSGRNIMIALEESMDAVFGPSDNKLAYPHAAGIRFEVESNLELGSRVRIVELDVDHLGLWRPINPRKFYSIVTTADIAKGAFGYTKLGEVIDHWKTPLPFTAGDAFLTYTLQNQNGWWELDSAWHSTQSFVNPDVEPRIAVVPEIVCLEWLPGSGKSDLCPLNDSIRTRGGGACNVVAWGLLDQNPNADIAIFKSSLCGSDIASGIFTDSHAKMLLPENAALVTLPLTGNDIVHILNRAVDFASGGDRPDAYPYAGALRYSVTSDFSGSQVSSVEVMNKANRWIPLSETDEYTVLTTKELATGQDSVYEGFMKVDDGTLQETNDGARETFIKFALAWKELYDPRPEKYSTQSFVS